MRKRIVKNIVGKSSKLSILIDESTTISQKPVTVVNIKAVVGKESFCEPEFIFLDLVQLESQTSDGITNALLSSLKIAGFTQEYLENNWISFISDGASVMLGKKSGVIARLRKMYPLIFTWHCMNHRLELAVGDTAKEVSGVNHFSSFVDSIHNVYSQSSKNETELSEISQELSSQILRIGRVLDTRWVASSFRTVHTIWTSYETLHAYFVMVLSDRSGKIESTKFYGLARQLESPEFLLDLGLMYDTLNELSNLSVQLQASSQTMERAHYLVDRTICVLETFKEHPGEKYKVALEAAKSGTFRGVRLMENSRLVKINYLQFLQSLCVSIRHRLLNSDHPDFPLLSDMSIIDRGTWPQNPSIRHGEGEIKRLYLR